MSGIEIERKFLVRKAGAPWRALASSSSNIKQGYMACKGATVRVRTRNEKAFLTIKGPSANGGMSRYEFETEIAPIDAMQLLKLCRGGLVEKTRYIVAYEGHTFEIDEFHGQNEGLVFAEVELKDENEAFELPDFIGPEVTGNRHFYNSHLLTDAYPNWAEELPEEYR